MKNWILLLTFAAVLYGADSKAEKEVRAAMDSWKQAMMGKNREALEKLFHPDLAYTHSTGRNETKAEAIKAVTEGRAKIEAIDIADSTTVHVYGNTALVKGNVDIRNNADGQVSTAHLDVLHVWVKGNGGWQMVARQAIRLKPQ